MKKRGDRPDLRTSGGLWRAGDYGWLEVRETRDGPEFGRVLGPNDVIDAWGQAFLDNGTNSAESTRLYISNGRSFSPLTQRPRRVIQPSSVDVFEAFAQTPLTPAGVHGFAMKYGLLDHVAGCILRIPPSRKGAKVTLVYAEPLFAWFQEIQAMSTALNLWRMVQAHDRDGLASWIRPDRQIWAQTTKIVFRIRPEQAGVVPPAAAPPALRIIASQRRRQEFLNEFRQANAERQGQTARTTVPHLIEVAALLLVADIINDGLGGGTSERLDLVRDGERAELHLDTMPNSLIGNLWSRVARFVSKTGFRACENCGRWFDAESARPDKRSCTPRCKRKLARHRDRVHELLAAGKSIAEVAKHLRRSEEQIQAWTERTTGKAES